MTQHRQHLGHLFVCVVGAGCRVEGKGKNVVCADTSVHITAHIIQRLDCHLELPAYADTRPANL